MRQLHLFKGKRQKGIVRNAPSEFVLQCAVADTLRRWATPSWQWTHLPFGEARTEMTGARLKRMGTNAGWPDFIFLSPEGRPFFLELKRRGGRLSESQRAFALWCENNGVTFRVTDSYDDVLRFLLEWGAVRSGITPQ